MLVFLIDGFNLVHKIPKVKSSSFPQQDLINYIDSQKLTGSKNNQVIIVFDGWISQPLVNQAKFQIVFSQDKSADDLIKARVAKAKNRAQILVVTDDRSIRDFARTQGVKSLKTIEFLGLAKRKSEGLDNANDKEISYSLQQQITEQMRKIWLNE